MNYFSYSGSAKNRRQSFFLRLVACSLCLFGPSSTEAADPSAAPIEALRQQLNQLQDQFEKTVQEQRRQIELLQTQIRQLQSTNIATPPAQDTSPTNRTGPAPATSLLDPASSSASAPAKMAPGSDFKSSPDTSSAVPAMTLFNRGSSFLNLSLNALAAAGASTESHVPELQLGAHDPSQRGFTLQNVEATFAGAIDPYFRGQANIIFQIDPEGESILEVEEAFLETIALPANLQVKAGQFFSEFGRLNPMHPHSWDFVDQPLVNGRFLGPDGLRNPGARISWLAPTPFYSELFLAVQNSHGETAHSFRSGHEGELFLGRIVDDPGPIESLNDLLFVPRYALSFDLSPTQILLFGASAALGPNATDRDAHTQIFGVDAYWKWKPQSHSGGFPFLSWQTEAMLRRFEAGLFTEDFDGNGELDASETDLNENGMPDTMPGETLFDYGVYSQIAWGFKRGWVAGLRGDFVAPANNGEYETLLGSDPDRAERWRISPNITWFPSEFSKLRLQYNHDHRDLGGTDHSIWFQIEFTLGAHGAHTF